MTVAVMVGILLTMATTNIGRDLIALGGLAILLTFGVLKPADAFAGFSNEGMLTVAILFPVAAALRETGCIGLVTQYLLGRPKSIIAAQIRLMIPTIALSAFINNTPLVAIMVPVINDWAKKYKLSASKLMIPLSYAAILGGTITLIGTSTNLVVNGLLIQTQKSAGLHFFDITWVGIPCALAGLAYMLIFSRWLLPDRIPIMNQLADPRQYTVEMVVEAASPLVGQTVETAGLRHLPGMFLVEIDREGDVLVAVGPQERLRAGDRLVFAGIVESVVDLQKIRGLTPATDQVFKLDAPRSHRCLVEAVVSNTCPVIGRTIREGRFRTQYNAAVIAVAHHGRRVQKKIGDIVLEAGDVLLLEAHPSFVDQNRNNRDFFLVSRIEDSTPPSHDKMWVALGVFAVMIVAVALGWISMLIAAMLAAGIMIGTRCISGNEARKSVDWQLLMVIAGAFGIGRALDKSGAAKILADHLIAMSGGNPWPTLAMIYGVTMLFTEVIGNNAAAALVFPIAFTTSQNLGVDYMPFVITVMMAASASFSTPIGYQTNLMVMGPGGYRFSDYFRIGIPLNLVMWATTVAVTPLVWPFHAHP